MRYSWHSYFAQMKEHDARMAEAVKAIKDSALAEGCTVTEHGDELIVEQANHETVKACR